MAFPTQLLFPNFGSKSHETWKIVRIYVLCFSQKSVIKKIYCTDTNEGKLLNVIKN